MAHVHDDALLARTRAAAHLHDVGVVAIVTVVIIVVVIVVLVTLSFTLRLFVRVTRPIGGLKLVQKLQRARPGANSESSASHSVRVAMTSPPQQHSTQHAARTSNLRCTAVRSRRE